jgi:hypothetical protein
MQAYTEAQAAASAASLPPPPPPQQPPQPPPKQQQQPPPTVKEPKGQAADPATSAPPVASEEDKVLPAGTRVQVHGLKQSVHLNGTSGVVGPFHKDKGHRYVVHLDSAEASAAAATASSSASAAAVAAASSGPLPAKPLLVLRDNLRVIHLPVEVLGTPQPAMPGTLTGYAHDDLSMALVTTAAGNTLRVPVARVVYPEHTLVSTATGRATVVRFDHASGLYLVRRSSGLELQLAPSDITPM